jgi:hypothetical protein
MEATVEKALDELLAHGAAFDYGAVRALADPERPLVPDVKIQQPDLGAYDRLLVAGGGL